MSFRTTCTSGVGAVARVVILLAILSCPTFLFVGCGGGGDGGGGDGGAPPQDQTTPSEDVNQAMTVAMPDSSSEAGSETQEGLENFSDETNLPDNEHALRDELDWWIEKAEANPDDPAAQLGLTLSMLAVAGHDGAHHLGYNLFDQQSMESAASMAFRDDLRADELASDAMNVASLDGVPEIRGGTCPRGVRPASSDELTPGELQNYRQAVREYLLPPIGNAIQRYSAIADSCCGSGTQLASVENNGETYAVYGADFHVLAAGLQLTRAALLMVSAVNPDYGNYDWDVDMIDRDSNNDGKLTVAEYAPEAPFGNIDGNSWTAAGAAIRDGVQRVSSAISTDCLPSDSNDLVVGALAESETSTSQWRTYLSDAQQMLSGQVSVDVEYANWDTESHEWVDQGSAQIPLNLRELWDNPPNSFRDLLPPLYVMLSYAWYEPEEGQSPPDWASDGFNIEAVTNDLENVSYGGYPFSEWVSSGIAMEMDNTAEVPISTPRYQMELAANPEEGSPAVTITFSDGWSECQVAYDGEQFTAHADYLHYDMLPRWSEIPDRTLSGVFADPDAMRDRGIADYDRYIYTYESLRYPDEPPDWVLY